MSEFIDDVVDHGSDWIITRHGRPVAVLLGHEDYEALIESLNILSDAEAMSAVAEGENDLAEGRQHEA